MLDLQAWAVSRRNAGKRDDLARFLRRSAYTEGLIFERLPAVLGGLRDVWDSRGSDDFTGNLLRAAAGTISSTTAVWGDLQAHKHVDDCPSVFRLGLACLLSPRLAVPCEPGPQVRGSFDLPPIDEREYRGFADAVMAAEGSEALRFAFAASMCCTDDDVPQALRDALVQREFHLPESIRESLAQLRGIYDEASGDAELLKVLLTFHLDVPRAKAYLHHRQSVKDAAQILEQQRQELARLTPPNTKL